MCKDNVEKRKNKYTRGRGVTMIFAKPINKISVIQERDAEKFVKEFNSNKVSDEFINSCKKAGELFGKKK